MISPTSIPQIVISFVSSLNHTYPSHTVEVIKLDWIDMPKAFRIEAHEQSQMVRGVPEPATQSHSRFVEPTRIWRKPSLANRASVRSNFVPFAFKIFIEMSLFGFSPSWIISVTGRIKLASRSPTISTGSLRLSGMVHCGSGPASSDSRVVRFVLMYSRIFLASHFHPFRRADHMFLHHCVNFFNIRENFFFIPCFFQMVCKGSAVGFSSFWL